MNNMYIRTKDNIYEITDKQYDVLCGNLTKEEKENFKNITSFGIGSVEEGTYKSILIKDIINHSENLDELCDGFYIDEGNEFSFYKENAYEDFEEAKEVFKQEFDDTSTLYGFIKTRKGLIYVAKMDSDPILKLF